MSEICWSQIAAMNQHYRNWSLETFLRVQEELGFESLELWLGPPHFYLDRLRCDDCGAVRKKAEAHHLHIVAVTSSSFAWQYQYAASPREIWESARAYFQNGIRAAAELGAKIMTVNSGWGTRDEPVEDSARRSEEMLRDLAEFAWAHGVTLALESLTSAETKIADTLEKTRRLWKQVDHPGLKLMADTVALGYQGESLEQWFEAFGDNLIHTHFVDMAQSAKSDDHLIWGDGDFSLPSMLETLKKYNFKGYLSQEIVADRYRENPMEADRKNRDALEQWVKRERRNFV